VVGPAPPERRVVLGGGVGNEIGEGFGARADDTSTGSRPSGVSSSPDRDRPPESLAELMGGGQGAADAAAAPVAFVIGWLLAEGSVVAGALSALTVAALVAGWRLSRGHRPRAVVVGLLTVALATVIALRTGRAADFFLVQLAANAASALAWTASIMLRWPLLGLVVGGVLGQGTRWRRDRCLLHAYSQASWAWVAQYLIRVVVFAPLWWTDQVLALGIARVALSWPMIAACLTVSWWLLMRALPDDHPGLRHPRTR
jgi:hypothetical protein